MLAKAAFPALFFTLAGFVLLLLVTLSVPIIKTIYLLSVRGPGNTGMVRMGVFGACYEGGDASFLGLSYSGFARCTDVNVSYDVDERFFGVANSGATPRVIKVLTGALILNPIAAGFAGISAILALLAWLCSSRIAEIACFATLILAALSAWIAFALDIAIALVARNRIIDYTSGVIEGRIGAAVWLALVGAICLTLAICAAGCGSFGRYSDRNRSTRTAASPGMTVVGEKPKRTWPWQRNRVHQSRGTY